MHVQGSMLKPQGHITNNLSLWDVQLTTFFMLMSKEKKQDNH